MKGKQIDHIKLFPLLLTSLISSGFQIKDSSTQGSTEAIKIKT